MLQHGSICNSLQVNTEAQYRFVSGTIGLFFHQTRVQGLFMSVFEKEIILEKLMKSSLSSVSLGPQSTDFDLKDCLPARDNHIQKKILREF